MLSAPLATEMTIFLTLQVFVVENQSAMHTVWWISRVFPEEKRRPTKGSDFFYFLSAKAFFNSDF